MKYYSKEGKPEGSEPLFTCDDAFEFISLDKKNPTEKVTLVGNLCTATDIIAEDIYMPHLENNDIIVITNAGAYGQVLSPFQFSNQEIPVELFLNKDHQIII